MDSATAERHIAARLRTRAALEGVKIKGAPTGPDFEGIAYKLMTPENDLVGVGEEKVAAPLQYEVVAVQIGDDASAATAWAMEAERALLRSAPAVNEFGQVFACQRLREVSFPARKDGIVRQIRGAVWRLTVRGDS